MDRDNLVGQYWDNMNDFWSLFDGRDLMAAIWKVMVEAVTEVGNYEKAVSQYSIDENDYKIEERWREFDISKKLDRNILDIPILKAGITDETEYAYNVDYAIEDGWIVWNGESVAEIMYAPSVYVVNPYIEKFFNDGFFDIAFDPHLLESIKIEMIRNVWKTFKNGPTKYNLWSLVNQFAGVPFNRYICQVDMSDKTKLSYLIPAYVVDNNGHTIIAKKKSRITCEVQTVNGLSHIDANQTILKGDIVRFGNDFAICMGNSVLDRLIAENEYSDVVVYTPYNKSFLQECLIYESGSGQVMQLDSKVLPKSLIYLVDKRNVVNGKIKDQTGNIVNDTGQHVVDDHRGEILPAFYPFYTKIFITGWDDVVDKKSKDAPNHVRYTYHNEKEHIYSPQGINGEIISLNHTSDLNTGDTVNIKSVLFENFPIKKIEKKGSHYWITIDDNFRHVFKKGEVVFICSDSDVYNKIMCVLIGGKYKYDTNQYVLQVDEDISSVSDPVLKSQTHQNRAKKITVDSGTIDVDGQIDMGINNLPIITKMIPGKENNSLIYQTSAESHAGLSTVHVSLSTNEVGNYMAIISDHKKMAIRKIIGQSATSVSIDKDLDITYSTNSNVVLLRRMPAHSDYTLSDGYIGGLREISNIMPSGSKINRTGDDWNLWITKRRIPVITHSGNMTYFKSR